MKFATKRIWQYPLHLRRLATLPLEIKNSNFLQIFSRYERKCKYTALNFCYLSTKFDIFGV